MVDLAGRYESELKCRIQSRTVEMKKDDNSHYLIYRVLGISDREGKRIDLYQNKGRFLYKYAGAFLEEAAIYCIKYRHKKAGKRTVENPRGGRPKMFEIDCLVDNAAHEIKWRDATTDGDHITKEHDRVLAIKNAGFRPIRVMFYYPQREQAKRVQETLRTLYQGVGGEYYCGDDAWEYIKQYTTVDLLNILKKIAETKNKQNAIH